MYMCRVLCAQYYPELTIIHVPHRLNLYSVVSTERTLVLHSLSRQYILGPLMAARYTGISRVRIIPLSLEREREREEES